ncbi:hypothetical protein [Streptomyces sp. NPDC057702]|uniref:hypothetical protein n=1 Tax=unclassified Streptomyces TaxID=2593676 RepID=UPI0036BFB58D
MALTRARAGAYAWTPPLGRGFHLLPLGGRWEAVRAPVELGAWMRENGEERVAHIATARYAVWLVPADEAAAHGRAWRVPGVRSLATGLLAVPQATRPESGTGLRWVMPRGWRGRHVARPAQLATDLAAAARAHWARARLPDRSGQ